MRAKNSEHLSVRVLRLVEHALDAAADPTVPTSVLLERAIRIARLRSDGDNLIWLTLEARTAGDQQSRDRVAREVRPYFSDYSELRRRWSAYVEEFIAERGLTLGGEDRLLAIGIGEVESRIQSQEELLREDKEEAWDAEVPLMLAQQREILARVRFRIVDYLTRVEKQVIFDELATGVFEGHRRYVDASLQRVAPDALDQLAAAYRRRAENDLEARTHALTSCRRALKTLADVLYPPPDEPVVGSDGRTRELGKHQYLSRLMQFVYEKSSAIDARLVRAQIEQLGGMLEALNDLSSKGVHDKVSEREVDHCVIQTYLTVGDILRIHDDSISRN